MPRASNLELLRVADAARSLNKHQQKTETTKRKLLQAALRTFSRDGFEAARIEDIAHEAGFTRGAFYAHFRSKEDLFFAILEEQANKQVERIRRAVSDSQNPGEQLENIRKYYLQLVSDRRWTILTLEFKLYAIRHPQLRAKLAHMHRSIRTKIKWEGLAGIWPGEKRPDWNKHSVRLALQVMLNGLVLERAYDPAEVSQAQTLKLLGELFDFLVVDPSARDSARLPVPE